MSGATFELEGLPEMAAALDRLADNVHDASADATGEMAEMLAQEWRARVPEGESPEDPHPGAYRAGIQVEHEETAGGGSALVNIRGEAVHYAHRLEFGAVGIDADGRRLHTPPRPSARPAWDATQQRMQAAAAARLRAAAERT